MNFVNLYTQTEYSLLQSALKINELIKKAKDYGYESLAISDHNTMHGTIKFYTECLNNSIKPIIGLRLDVISDFNYINSILLYAKNNDGYKNLMLLSTLKNTSSRGLKLIDIYKYLNDLVIVLPSTEHELVKAFLEDATRNLNTIINNYLDVMTKLTNSDLYLGLDLQTKVLKNRIKELINLSNQYNIKTVALNKTAYLTVDDCEVYRIVRSVECNAKDYVLQESERRLQFISNQSAFDLFRGYPDLLNETIVISEMCNVTIEFGKYKMPYFDKSIKDAKVYLHDLAIFGLKKRLETSSIDKNEYKTYLSRLLYELDVINKMGFNDYFLIVYDFIRFSKKHKILVGPGRGSGPGSIVAYSLGITEVDPIKFNLLFERFLNPERVSMPDIDTDFPDDSRDLVIKYMAKKYGLNRVSHICTFGTYGPRLAIRDVARVINLKSLYLDEILNFVGNDVSSIDEALDSSVQLRRMYNDNETIKYVLKMANKLENLPRNLSVHAAGIIMADDDLVKYTPLSSGINGLYQTQYEALDLEKLGLVKIDFLSLRNLTIINKVLTLVKQNEGKDININKISLEDEKTFKLLRKLDTDGIFQLESSGMKNTLKQLDVGKFIDIVDALALYRPGPMEMIPLFCKRKKGLEKVTYIHNDLMDILKPTYGTIVYQEQIMQIASKFSSFSLGESDLLRRAISKKKISEIEKLKSKFIIGAMNNGYDEKTSNGIYDLILKFSNYGFNKSHSVAYSFVSYQMAYLKAHYYMEFMSVLLSYSIGKTQAIKNYILECNKNNIEVMLPSINKSGIDFNICDRKIYYSLLGINGIGDVITKSIIEERDKYGLYKDYDDFISRTKTFMTRKAVEALIYSGALDEFNLTRKTLINEYDKSIEIASFGEMFKEQLIKRDFSDDEFTFEEISNFERFTLGFNLKYNIFNQYAYIKKKYKTVDLSSVKAKTNPTLLIMFDTIKVIKTKKGDEMAFVTVSDDTFTLDGVIFPKTYNQIKDDLIISKLYLASSTIDVKDDKLQVIINNLHYKR